VRRIFAISMALALGTGQAWAAGPCNSPLSDTELATTLNGHWACQVPEWNEQHTGVGAATSGNIVDYKKGPHDPVDPSTTVGTYSIAKVNGKGVVTYAYGPPGSSTFSYNVQNISGNSYSFCQITPGNVVLTITVQNTHC